MTLLRNVSKSLKAELPVALKTFGLGWLLLTLGLVLLTLVRQGRGAGGGLGVLALGVVICAVHAFWPALAVAACRTAYRLVGAGAYVGALVALVGVVTSLLLLRNAFFSMFLGAFEALNFSGTCEDHPSEPSLSCLIEAVLGSPGSWWPLFELFLAISGAILLGSAPGVVLWLALLARKQAKLASVGVSR